MYSGEERESSDNAPSALVPGVSGKRELPTPTDLLNQKAPNFFKPRPGPKVGKCPCPNPTHVVPLPRSPPKTRLCEWADGTPRGTPTSRGHGE